MKYKSLPPATCQILITITAALLKLPKSDRLSDDGLHCITLSTLEFSKTDIKVMNSLPSTTIKQLIASRREGASQKLNYETHLLNDIGVSSTLL